MCTSVHTYVHTCAHVHMYSIVCICGTCTVPYVVLCMYECEGTCTCRDEAIKSGAHIFGGKIEVLTAYSKEYNL